MNLNKIIYSILLSILLLSCKKEATLKPEPGSTMYTLPQGNHPYDARIVDFHQKNGTYILYKFNAMDFRWNITNLIPYLAKEADEAWVEPSLNFLEEQLFNLYTPVFLKKMLPYKILLSSNIREITPVDGSIDTLDTPVMSTYSYSHLAFGNCNSNLPLMSATEITAAKSQLHRSLWSSAIQGDRIELPPVFIAATDYTMVYEFNFANYGVLEASADYKNIGDPYTTVAEDMIAYLGLITTKSKAELESTLFMPSNDPKGRYRFKYEAIIDYYKTTYQINLETIAAN